MKQFKDLCHLAFTIYEAMENSRWFNGLRSSREAEKAQLKAIIEAISPIDSLELGEFGNTAQALTELSERYERELKDSKLTPIVRVLAIVSNAVVIDQPIEEISTQLRNLTEVINKLFSSTSALSSFYPTSDPAYAKSFTNLVESSLRFLSIAKEQKSIDNNLRQLEETGLRIKHILTERASVLTQLDQAASDAPKEQLGILDKQLEDLQAEEKHQTGLLREQIQKNQASADRESQNLAAVKIDFSKKITAIENEKIIIESEKRKTEHKNAALEKMLAQSQQDVALLEAKLSSANQKIETLTTTIQELNEYQEKQKTQFITFSSPKELNCAIDLKAIETADEWLTDDDGPKNFTNLYNTILQHDKLNECAWATVLYERLKNCYRGLFERASQRKIIDEASGHARNDILDHYENLCEKRIKNFTEEDAFKREISKLEPPIPQPSDHRVVEHMQNAAVLHMAEFHFAKAAMKRIQNIRTGKIDRLQNDLGEFFHRNNTYFQTRMNVQFQKELEMLRGNPKLRV